MFEIFHYKHLHAGFQSKIYASVNYNKQKSKMKTKIVCNVRSKCHLMLRPQRCPHCPRSTIICPSYLLFDTVNGKPLTKEHKYICSLSLCSLIHPSCIAVMSYLCETLNIWNFYICFQWCKLKVTEFYLMLPVVTFFQHLQSIKMLPECI